MKKEKLEKQKIDENEMKNAAGGYSIGTNENLFYTSPLSFDKLILNEDERLMLEKAGCIKKGGNKISKRKLSKALELLGKKSKFEPSDGEAIYQGHGKVMITK